MAKKQIYQNLPLHFYKQQNGHYKNIKTGKWVSKEELENYAVAKKVKREVSVRVVTPSWHNNYDNY